MLQNVSQYVIIKTYYVWTIALLKRIQYDKNAGIYVGGSNDNAGGTGNIGINNVAGRLTGTS